MKKYQYQIIRYVHDHFTGEFVNVGVVVYSKEEKFLSSKTISRYQRVNQLFPDANGKWIIKVLHHFNSGVQKASKELNELFTPSEKLEHLTNAILSKDNNAIRLSETKFAIDMDLNAALDGLYYSQVEKYEGRKADSKSLLDEDIWKFKYKQYFEKYGIDKRLQIHEVQVPKDIISFEKSWKNEIWHCYEPLSFVLQEKDAIKDKVYKWAGKLQGLQQANEKLTLTLLTSIAPDHQDLTPFIKNYLMIDSPNIKVKLITEDQAENLAKEIKKEIDEHDSTS